MFLAALMLVSLAGAVDARPSAAVLELQSKQGVGADVASLLADSLTVNLRKSGAFSRVVSTTELAATLGVEQQRQAANCDDASCLVEIAGALGVDLLVFGNVGKVGRLWLMNLKMVSARTGVSVSSVSRPLEGDDETVLLLAMKDVVREMLLPLTEGAPPEQLPVAAPDPIYTHAWVYPALGAAVCGPLCAAGCTMGMLGCFLTYSASSFSWSSGALFGSLALALLGALGGVIAAPVSVVTVAALPVITLVKGRGRFTVLDQVIAGSVGAMGALLVVGGGIAFLTSMISNAVWVFNGLETGGSDKVTVAAALLAGVTCVVSLGLLLGGLVMVGASIASVVAGTTGGAE